MSTGKKIKIGRAFFLHAVFTLIVFLLAGCPQPVVDYSGTATPVLAIKNAPEGIDSLTITVTADDMADLEFNYSPPPASIELEIPAGPARRFEVVVEVDNASPAKKYEGSSTVDLAAGEASSVTVAMALTETKILIPDEGNHRIVQIDDMQGTNWTMLTGGQLGYDSEEFLPYDVDLDGQLRIYIAYFTNNYSSGGLFRIDNMSGTGRIPIVSGHGVTAVAVDNANNYIYYIKYFGGEVGYNLCRRALEPLGSEEVFDLRVELEEGLSGFTSKGLDVGPGGRVYISNSFNDYREIYKFNPNASQGFRIEAIYETSYGSFDVVVKVPFVYITDSFPGYVEIYEKSYEESEGGEGGERSEGGGSSGAQITRLDLNLGNAVSYGDYITSAPPTSPGELWYPQRFLAVMNKKIYFIDEGVYYNWDRIVSFDDITGDGWQVYGEHGSGVGQFRFYCYEESGG